MSIASPNLPQSGERANAAESAPASAFNAVAAAGGDATSRVIDGGAPVSRENLIQRGVAGLLGRRAFWVLFVFIAFSWPLVRVIRTALPPKLPVLGTVASFELVDQTGQPFGTTELAGKVWVVSAIRTSSPAADDLAKELGKIQHRVRNLGPAFHVVTVGLDPQDDTPDRLLDFTGRHRVSPRIWRFLSGDAPALRRAQAALGLEPAGAARNAETPVATPRPGGTPASPSDHVAGPLSVALVDTKMHVRGYYDLADPSAIDTLLYHVGLLVNRGD